MSLWLSIEEKIQIVLLYAKYENIQEVKRRLKNHFAPAAPVDETIRNTVNKFKETGNVHDQERSGLPRSVVTEEANQNIREMMQEDANISIQRDAGDINMTRSSYHRVIKEAGLRPFRLTTVHELSDDDFDRRKEFCDIMLADFDRNSGLVDNIIWSDVSQFTLKSVMNHHNCCYWAFSYPSI